MKYKIMFDDTLCQPYEEERIEVDSKKPKGNIYCEDCKHMFLPKQLKRGGYIPISFYCKKNPGFLKTPFCKQTIYSRCCSKNIRNDCKDYEPKRNIFKKLKLKRR
ncbi:MAG TPA: hypothetical protein VK982_10460 [Bacteroidales bacterium]|nr:hypothetical protein [Bacteroidales bacterium]